MISKHYHRVGRDILRGPSRRFFALPQTARASPTPNSSLGVPPILPSLGGQGYWYNTFATTTGNSDSPSPPPSDGTDDDTKNTDTNSTTTDASPTPDDAAESTTQSTTTNLRPSQVVAGLDQHIVGQADAKRAVAIAMRNRWRRQQLTTDEMRREITPRNVLLVGPTGCGKTEVARRMALLNEAPFLKVEATKFTEVGYHGRDVDQIVRDLMDVGMQLTKKHWTEKLKEKAKASVNDRILDLLAGPSFTTASADAGGGTARSRESFRSMLEQGILDDQEIELDVPTKRNPGLDIMAESSNPNMATVTDLVQKIAQQDGKRKSAERKKLPISEARNVVMDIELGKLLEAVDIKKEALQAVQETGIVFIDEIDKICTSSRDSFGRSADASAEGVQRDLLPLIEGTTINTKYGNVNTDYILFIASGAFHAVKPSDMLPELQGRLPIRVELKGLTEDDLYRILTEPVANLVRQQKELLKTEGVELVFEDEAIREIARMAAHLNKTVENIGARRLHTVMERIMEELSFEAAEIEQGSVLTVDKALVEKRLEVFSKSTDISKYIL